SHLGGGRDDRSVRHDLPHQRRPAAGIGGSIVSVAMRPSRFWLIALGISIALLWLLADVLMPFAAAMAVAYLLDPVTDRLQRLRAPLWLATTLVLRAFFILAILLLILLVPIIEEQVSRFIQALPTYRPSLHEIFSPIL